MPIFIETDTDPRTTGTYEADSIPQGFKAPDEFGRMRPNQFAGAKIGGGYDAPQGTPTWEPSWDQNAGGHPDQLYDNKINRIISEGHHKQDKWEELGGPNFNEGRISPGWVEAGLPATNQGYKVMNAGLFDDPTADGGWIDRLSRWWYGDDDPENDFQENPSYDPNNPNHFMVPDGMDPELFEPGIENLQAGMDDSLQSLQYDIDQLDPDSPNYDDMLELLNSDIDMKYPWAQMAGLTQTWQDIVDRTGSEDLANQWLATQQANRGGIIGLI